MTEQPPVQLDPLTPCGLCAHTAEDHADASGRVLACQRLDCPCDAWCEYLVLTDRARGLPPRSRG